MIYPLLPAFLTGTLRAGPAFLGVVEGLAETVAAVLKIVSGGLSDRLRRRKPLVVAGYSLSSAVRPLVALATVPAHVLAVRVVDRVGKGVRSAPRDALVAQVVAQEDRGRAFGFQRAMDHAGAMVGPLVASAVLLAFLFSPGFRKTARREAPRVYPPHPGLSSLLAVRIALLVLAAGLWGATAFRPLLPAGWAWAGFAAAALSEILGRFVFYSLPDGL